MVKSMKMVEAGRKSWVTRRLRSQQNESAPVSSRSEAAHKAWATIRKNRKLFKGMEEPGEYKFGIHLMPYPSCACHGEEEVKYYKEKEDMRKDLKKFRKDDSTYAICVFQIICETCKEI